MAKPLNKYQKQINSELNKLDASFKNFTAKDFDTNENALMLEKLFKAYERYEAENYIDTTLFVDYNDLHSKFQEYLFLATGKKDFKENLLWQAGDKRYDYEAVEKFWGIKRISLINKLIHDDYTLAVMENNEHFDNPISESYYNNRNRWISLCKTIDQFIKFTNEKFPNWSTMKKSEKNQYIKYLEELSEAPFLSDSENLNYYVQFLSKYGLNQSKKVKAKLLLQFNFPHVDNEKIALEIIEFTNLFIFSKN